MLCGSRPASSTSPICCNQIVEIEHAVCKPQHHQGVTDIAPVGGRELWEPLPGETVKAFHAFALYRDLGAYRSIAKVGKTLADDRGNPGSTSQVRELEKWSSKYQWVERVEAWELYRDRREREAVEDEIDRMKRRHARLGQLAAGAAMERLVGREPGIRPDGTVVAPVQRLDPNTLDAMDVARLMKAGVEVERLSKGLPTTVAQAMNTLTRTEAEKVWTQLIELGLRYTSEDRHEAFLRDVQAIGEKRG